MADPSASDISSLKTSIDALTVSVKNMGGFQLPSIGNVITGTVGSLTKLTSGTFGLNDALELTTKAFNVFPVVGGVMGDVLGKVGRTGIEFNNVLKDVSKSGMNFGLDMGLMVNSITGARMSLPEFQAMVKENSVALKGLAGDAAGSGLRFLAFAKDVQESNLGRELKATGVGAEELNKALGISTSIRRGSDLTTKESNIAVVESALSLAREMDNVARLTGISRQEQEKAVQAQLRKNEVEIALMAMDEDQREAYLKGTASLSAFGKDAQDVFTAFKTGGLRTAEDSMKAAALGPEFTRLIRELSEIEGNDDEANRRRKAVMEAMDAETLRLANNKEELRIRAAQVTAGGEWGQAQGRVIVGMKDYATALQQIQRDGLRAGETIEQAKARIIKEIEDQRRAARTGEVSPEQMAATVINRTEDLFKDISAGVGTAFDAANKKAFGLGDAFQALNDKLTPITQASGAQLGRAVYDKITAVGEGNREAIETSTNPAISGSDEAEAQRRSKLGNINREAFGSEDVFGGWFKGPLNRLSFLAEREVEASVPWSKRSEFITDIARDDPSVLAPLMKEMQSSLASASTSSADSIKGLMTEIMNTVPTLVSGSGSTASNIASSVAGSTAIDSGTEIQIELVKGINNLNKLTTQLIETVESTGSSTARAIKSKGNLIA